MTDLASDTPADPIRKSVTVPLDRASAFELFTDGIDRWWPKETHSLTSGDGDGRKARVHIEPHVGGRVLETMPDGRMAPWGTVETWSPGERFALRWYVGRDEAEATLVDVRFTQTDAGTRVDLTHSGFDVLGSKAAEMCANYTGGWEHVLGRCYAGACATALA